MLKIFLTILSVLPAVSSAAVSVSTDSVEGLYNPASSRDPMVESTVFSTTHGERNGGGKSGESRTAAQTNIKDLTLVGIMEDSRGRLAILKSRSETFMLKNGRIINSKKKAIEGAAGIIKGKEVILLDSDKNIVRLKMGNTKF